MLFLATVALNLLAPAKTTASAFGMIATCHRNVKLILSANSNLSDTFHADKVKNVPNAFWVEANSFWAERSYHQAVKADYYQSMVDRGLWPANPEIQRQEQGLRDLLELYRERTRDTAQKHGRLIALRKMHNLDIENKIELMNKTNRRAGGYAYNNFVDWKTNGLQSYHLIRKLFGHALDHLIDLDKLHRQTLEAAKGDRQVTNNMDLSSMSDLYFHERNIKRRDTAKYGKIEFINWPKKFDGLEDFYQLRISNTKKKHSVASSKGYYENAQRANYGFQERFPILVMELVGEALHDVIFQLEARGNRLLPELRNEIRALEKSVGDDLSTFSSLWSDARREIVERSAELTRLRVEEYDILSRQTFDLDGISERELFQKFQSQASAERTSN